MRLNNVTALCLFAISLIFSATVKAELDFLKSSADDEFLPVERAFQVDFYQNGETLELSWQIANGYYLYKDQTKAKAGEQILTLTFDQSGNLKHDEYFGEVTVFRDQLGAAINLTGITQDTLLLTYQGCADAGLCYPPQLIEVPITPVAGNNQSQQPPQVTSSNTELDLFSAENLFITLIGFFVLGIGLSLTPCVLPMVPILSSIISAQKSTQVKSSLLLSLAYVLGMALFYTVSGVLVGYFGARFNIQLYLQEPWVVALFVIFFVAMALSMFGLYELQLPTKLREKLPQQDKSNKGLLATFVTGGISALALSPCVSAPLASALVYISATGDAFLGGAALFTLSIGMGLPLILMGAGLGKALPKAGQWMIQVKQAFGVIMLGMAIWLVARILPDLASAALWSAFGLWLALQIGLHAGQNAWQRNRQALAWLILIGAAYHFYTAIEAPKRGHTKPTSEYSQHPQLFKRVDSVEALNSLLQVSNKKIVVDLYADWCVSCVIMEEKVFSKVKASDYPEFQFIQLDLTDMTNAKQNFLAQHKLFGPPSLLIFAPDNQAQALFTYQAEFSLQQLTQWLATQ